MFSLDEVILTHDFVTEVALFATVVSCVSSQELLMMAGPTNQLARYSDVAKVLSELIEQKVLYYHLKIKDKEYCESTNRVVKTSKPVINGKASVQKWFHVSTKPLKRHEYHTRDWQWISAICRT